MEGEARECNWLIKDVHNGRRTNVIVISNIFHGSES